jgi:hypothetical protein
VAEGGADLPIDDYDRLRASDIIPLLADLDASELEQVRDYEEGAKHRFTVLRRIDSELATREPAGWEVSDEDWEAEPEGDAEVVVVEEEVVEVDTVDDEDLEEAEEEEEAEELVEELEALDELEDELEEEEEEEEEEAMVFAAASSGFPIPEYDQLMMLEVLPRLMDLDEGQLVAVRQHEEMGLARSTILNRLNRLIDERQSEGPSTAARRAARKAAAPRAPARKAAARKAPAKKASARKATARKAPAKKTVRKTTTKKVVARKAPAKKAAARKAPAKKTSTRSRRA